MAIHDNALTVDVDLDGAAALGIIGEDQAQALRRYMAERSGMSAPSTEKFQLMSGFADVMRAIAVAFVLGGLPVIVSLNMDRRAEQSAPLTEVILPYAGSAALLIVAAALALWFLWRQGPSIAFSLRRPPAHC